MAGLNVDKTIHLALNIKLCIRKCHRKDKCLTGSTFLSSLPLLIHIVPIISAIVIVAAFRKLLSLRI